MNVPHVDTECLTQENVSDAQFLEYPNLKVLWEGQATYYERLAPILELTLLSLTAQMSLKGGPQEITLEFSILTRSAENSLLKSFCGGVTCLWRSCPNIDRMLWLQQEM